MGTLKLSNGHLDYTLHTAAGEPLLLLHGSPMAAILDPLIRAPELQDRYQIISYRRQGHQGNSCPATAMTMQQHASDGMALLKALDIPRAHLLGYSVGAGIAMQWVLDDRQSVQSLCLLEPPLMNWVPSGHAYFEGASVLLDLYQQEKRAQVRSLILQSQLGEDYLAVLAEHGLEGAPYAGVLTDLDVLFRSELPAIKSWVLDETELRQITAPVLTVQGMETAPFFAEGQRLLKTWWPAATELLLAHSGHVMPLQNPMQLAQGIAEFLAKHPFQASTSDDKVVHGRPR